MRIQRKLCYDAKIYGVVIQKRFVNVSVGDQVSGLDNSTGRGTSGYKVTYDGECGRIMGDTDDATVIFNARQAYELRFAILTTGTEKVFGLGQPAGYGSIPLYAHWGAGDNGTTFSIYQAMGGSAGYEPSDWDDNSGGTTYQK